MDNGSEWNRTSLAASRYDIVRNMTTGCEPAGPQVTGVTWESFPVFRRRLTALRALTCRALELPDDEPRLRYLLSAGAHIFGSDAVTLWLVDTDRSELRFVDSSAAIANNMCDRVGSHDVDAITIPNLQRVLDEENLALNSTGFFLNHAFSSMHWTWVPICDGQMLAGYIGIQIPHDHSGSLPWVDRLSLDAFASVFTAVLRSSLLSRKVIQSGNRFSEFIETSPVAVLLTDRYGLVDHANRAATLITGRTSEQLCGRYLFDWIVDPVALPWPVWCALAPRESGFPVDTWIARPSGERRRVTIHARCVVPDAAGDIAISSERRLQLSINDITESTRRIAELELLDDLTRMVSEQRSLEDVYEVVSSRLYEFLNYRLVTIGEFDGHLSEVYAYRNYLTDLTLPLVFDVEVGLCGLAIRENRSVLAERVSEWDEYLEIDEDVQSEAIALIRMHGKPVGLIDIQSDSTQPLGPQDLKLIQSIATHIGFLMERIGVSQNLRQLALTDPLTGIRNRRSLVEELVARTSSLESDSFGLLFIELDLFKVVNDRLGHLFGDEMLKQVSARLQQSLRDDDVIARYGGDEIAVVAPGLTSGNAMEFAEQLRSAIAREVFLHDGQSATMTVSIGVALFPEHGRTTDDILGAADRAMYEAKRRGRNSVYVEPSQQTILAQNRDVS